MCFPSSVARYWGISSVETAYCGLQRIICSKLLLMAFKNFTDTSSRNAYDFSYKQKAVVWLRVVNRLLFDFNATICFINQGKNVHKICRINRTKVFIYEKSSTRKQITFFTSLNLVYQHVLRFIVSEVKMLSRGFAWQEQ